jgi:hypothetical protein
MTVAAAAMLDSKGLAVSQDFGIQEKNPIIASSIMKNLVKVRGLIEVETQGFSVT